jgi:hypothetical protein
LLNASGFMQLFHGSQLPDSWKEMNVIAAIIIGGAVLIVLVLWDAFETIVFPRRVTRRVRLARLFFLVTWRAWKAVVRLIPAGRLKQSLLSIYGPLSLLVLLGFWAIMLILGFGLLYWGAAGISGGQNSIAGKLYFSGTTFFTLGYVQPLTPLARLLTVAEAGTGLGFLAIVIGYLPALNQSFSRREVNISLLDARAGSPPTAGEMLVRHNDEHGMESIRQLLHEWERWSAELLESHLSYPVLAYFRSQHDNQSWLAALTSILDASAFVMVGLDGACVRQAQLTFAMARHAIVDLCLVFGISPRLREPDRLSPAQLKGLRSKLRAAGLRPETGEEADRKLAELRGMYEPFLFGLSRHFQLSLPPWVVESSSADNWQASVLTPEPGDIKIVLPRRRSPGHF